MKTPYVILIMDGYGIAPDSCRNSIFLARTPVLNGIFGSCPTTYLLSSGKAVGLPEGQIGNSEVGHTNIGAGRVVFQILPRISNAIEDGSFFRNEALKNAVEAGKNGALHIMGLLSDGGVHSHNTHLYALLKMARDAGVQKVYIHAFLDGRDVSPTSGEGFVRDCVAETQKLGVGRIATVMGRFYAMDRDKRWDRVEKAYNAIVFGEGEENSDPAAAVAESYKRGVTDEFMEPVVCDRDGMVKPGDSVIFFNFRPDRARELTYALTQESFTGFERRNGLFPLHYTCMARYDEELTGLPVAFPPAPLHHTFGEIVSDRGMKQLRIAETEKYAHVTFFFNGGEEKVFPGEDRILVPSPKQFPTYDLIPEMSAVEVTDKCVAAIESGEYDAVVMNLANCDMVGHTGVMEAAIKAVETVDACVGRVRDAVQKMGGVLCVTGDHGNADVMMTDGGEPQTAHTTNPVPFVVCGRECRLRPGRLADITPTVLELMGIPKPEEMTGESLIIQ